MKRVWWSLFCLSMALGSGLAFAWKVENINFVVDGDEDIPFLHNVAGIKQGEEFSYQRIDEALTRLGQTGRFRYAEARVAKGSSAVFFVLRSIYKVGSVRVNFENQAGLSRDKLNELEADVIGEITVKSGDPVDLSALDFINFQVIARLEARGYIEAEAITIFEEIPKTQLRNLVINVLLPKPTSFSKFDFEGFSEIEKTVLTAEYARETGEKNFLIGMREKNFARAKSTMDLVALNTVLERYQRELRENGYYDAKVHYDGDQATGEIKVIQSRGNRYRVDFEGATFFWERFLRDRVLERVQNFSVPFDPNDVASQVSELYRQYGFKNIQIQWTTEVKSDSRTGESHYTFQIKEGEQYFLGGVVFQGGIGREESRDAEEAKRQWIAENSDPLHFIYFNESALRAKTSSLLRLIREKGYIEAKFVDIKFEPRENSRRMDLVVNLQVGQKFYVESISFVGLSFLSEEVRKSFLNFGVGDEVQPSKILETNSEIERYLKNHGFTEARVENSEDLIFRKRPTFNRVDVLFQAQSGPKVLVGSPVIEGNETTKEKVIRRELYEGTLENGRPWSLDGERRLRENLLALGIFGSAQTEKIAGRVVGFDPDFGYEIQQKDLKITLRERPAGAIEFGPGFRTDLGIIGFAQFNYRNLFGENYGFLTRAQASRKINNYQFLEQRYSATFMNPYFLSQRIRMRTSASYQKEDDTVFVNGRPDRGLSIEEANLSLAAEFLVAEKWSWIQNIYTLSLPRLFGIIDTASEDDKRSEKYRIGTVGSSLIYDGRDNIFNPSRGLYSVSSFEYAGPFLGSNADVNFLVYRQDLTRYFRTGPGSVIALSAEFARLWGFSDSQRGVPANKRLFLGGQTSLRFLPEKFLRYDDEGVKEQQSFEFKAEYRQPWIYDMSVAFFMDVGRLDVLNPSGNDELSTGWRHGLGVGLRYATPVGPIALDFAFNLNPEPEESNYQIQFSIGIF